MAVVSLRSFGYSTHYTSSQRWAALDLAVKSHGYDAVFNRLNEVFGYQTPGSRAYLAMEDDLDFMEDEMVMRKPKVVSRPNLDRKVVAPAAPASLSLRAYGYSTYIAHETRRGILHKVAKVYGADAVIARLTSVYFLQRNKNIKQDLDYMQRVYAIKPKAAEPKPGHGDIKKKIELLTVNMQALAQQLQELKAMIST